MSAEYSDLYKILQVDPDARPEVIEAAYRFLSETYHPDHDVTDDLDAWTAEINRAYGILSDPRRRASYDRDRPGTAIGDLVPDVISAKSFRLLNETGHTRAELSLDQNGEPQLIMNDRNGKCWLEVYHDPEGPCIDFNDLNRDARLSLGLTIDGNPYLAMFDQGVALKLELNDVHPQLEFRNRSGVVRLAFVERDDGTPTLEIVEQRRIG